MTCKYVFDLRDEDVYWCTADVGWVTGHSYVVYGPLAMGATSLMYEGAPNWPENDRFLEDHRRIRRDDLLHRADRDPRVHEVGRRMDHQTRSLLAAPARHRRRTDQSRGVDVVSPTSSAADAARSCDTWWQTETGGHMITPLPGATPTKPGTATLPFFGVDAAIVDDEGKEVAAQRGRQARHPQAVALHAARHLGRQGALQEDVLERSQRHVISPATARAATRTAISGSSAASTTCSTSPAIGSAPPKSKARSSRTGRGRGRGRRAPRRTEGPGRRLSSSP